MITFRFDGLFRRIPTGRSGGTIAAGFMSYGWLIGRDGVQIARGYGVVARGQNATSNVAEYLALIEGMEALQDLGVAEDETVVVCGDAKCIIDQMRGAANVNSPRMKPLYHRARRLADSFPAVEWLWTPRRQNKEADQLTRHAMRQMRIDPNHYEAVVRAIDPRQSNGRQSNKLVTLVDLRVYHPAVVVGAGRIMT